MDFLAGESCDFAAVRALRAVGHDVEAVAEWIGGAPDHLVMQTALESGRILLTEDKDFGQLVYANRQESRGVILIRFPARARTQLGPTVVAAVTTAGDRLYGSFVVVQPGRVRIGHEPDVEAPRG
jgi:predicted nuclease of predicted toxin-antitoxin system